MLPASAPESFARSHHELKMKINTVEWEALGRQIKGIGRMAEYKEIIQRKAHKQQQIKRSWWLQAAVGRLCPSMQ